MTENRDKENKYNEDNGGVEIIIKKKPGHKGGKRIETTVDIWKLQEEMKQPNNKKNDFELKSKNEDNKVINLDKAISEIKKGNEAIIEEIFNKSSIEDLTPKDIEILTKILEGSLGYPINDVYNTIKAIFDSPDKEKFYIYLKNKLGE